MLGWHVEAHVWCFSEGKGSLCMGEQVGLVHGPLRGLEAHRKAKTQTWGGDCWVYTCDWSPTLNNDEKNE